MPLPKPIRLFLYYTAGLLGLILLLLVIISLFRIPINLEGHKGLIESFAADAIERQVKIDGTIKVTTSLWPVFIVEDVHVKNPTGFSEGDFARLQAAKIEIGLIRLLLGRIRVKDFEVKGLELSLQTDESGAVNWILNDDQYDEFEKPEEKSQIRPEQKEIASDAIIVDRLYLSNISVSYIAPDMEKPNEFIIDKCKGSALSGEAFQITLEGTTLEEPYEVSIRAASLEELLEESKSWVDIEVKIAQAQLNFSVNVDLAEVNRSLQLKLEIKGKGLENFNRLLNLDLPPIPTYGLNASFAAQKGFIELDDLLLYVSDSALTGSMKVDNTRPIPVAELTLHSPQVQINDFVFDDWSPFQKNDEAGDKVMESKTAETGKKVGKAVIKKEHAEKASPFLQIRCFPGRTSWAAVQ
jgi:uncharacterized protein involved in outer membrane biogenesis